MDAYFAGGCFWCISSVFTSINGINSVTSGYSGGDEINPSYDDVKKQNTGHRETIKINYDENIISYSQLLEIFLNNVDVYDPNGQYIDKGHSYTLAIYYIDDNQKEIAANRINQYKEKVFISIEKFKSFYEAEEYHQNYHLKHPKEFDEELIASGRKTK